MAFAYLFQAVKSFSSNQTDTWRVVADLHIEQVRYMDSREDEQRRGITMKSSSIALGHKVAGMWNPGSVFFFISVRNIKTRLTLILCLSPDCLYL